MSTAPRDRSGRCWYCGERHLAPDDPPEHIIPAALGAELTTDVIAESCNRRAGREIDQPLVDDLFVVFNRVFYDIRDRRGRRPPNPVRNATFKDGSPALLETRETPWRAEVIPQVREEGDRFIVTAGSVEEAEAMIAKRSERTGQQFQVIDQRRSKEDHPEVVFTISLDTRIRVRARAKMVLGALSKVLSEEWLDSPEAVQLRDWMWDPRPKRDGVEVGAMHAGADGLLGFMCQPPEHLVALIPMGGNRLMVMVMLFGKEVMPYEVQLPDIEAPETCWVMDPRKRTVRELRYMELIQEVGVRLDEAHDTENRGA